MGCASVSGSPHGPTRSSPDPCPLRVDAVAAATNDSAQRHGVETHRPALVPGLPPCIVEVRPNDTNSAPWGTPAASLRIIEAHSVQPIFPRTAQRDLAAVVAPSMMPLQARIAARRNHF